ncbi:MAG TPA: hypothetical protein PLQ97_09235 [Myxococcota bacterium]|nr:hypothetical protein [Myxococcota bacterium]HQK50961.1 hypothetical protein [Myxococcota bacterium]
MTGRIATVGWLLFLLALPGCYEARTSNPDLWFLDTFQDMGTPDPGSETGPVDLPSDQAQDPGSDPGADVVTDAPLPDTNRRTGSPCETNEQCWTEQCLTTEFVQILNPNLEVPGGMCSLIGCGDDSECGPGDGSICLDATSLGNDIPRLCAWPCAADQECREGYVCPDFGAKDGQGNPVKTCLPAKLVGLLVCDQGKCAAEPKDPYCPEACPE